MPSGLALDLPGVRAGTVKPLCAPPRGFRPARPLWAELVVAGPWHSGSRRPIRGTAAQRFGLHYERRVLDNLKFLFPSLQCGPWFRFAEKGGYLRWCQPDALLRTEAADIIFEVKSRFTSDAYYQLRQLYAPVVERAFRAKAVRLVNIVRSFDPSVPFPEPHLHLEALTLSSICGQPPLGAAQSLPISVHVWRL